MGALVAALTLAGCGRKGPLDPPPSAAISQQGPAQPGQQEARFDEEGRPVAPSPNKANNNKPFILDWLLN